MRLRSDEQLVALFRAGHDEAFRAIHDRYKGRLFAYARQMLPARQDAEDALQDVFLRAYAGLRASDRELALRAWLYRVAHNRCIDQLRRPVLPAPERLELRPAIDDPVAQADQRESLRRLVADIRRLPDQQRSALLMRELAGMSYADVAGVLGISVPAVKSLLVRARMALVQAIEARDAACSEIRSELMTAHDRRVRPGAMARRHMRDCAGCREFRRDLRGVSRQLAALGPAVGPVGMVAKLLGVSSGAGGGAAAGGGGAAAGGAVGGTGAAACSGALAGGVGHVATLLAATVVAAGGAVEIQHTIAGPAPVRHHLSARPASRAPSVQLPATTSVATQDPASSAPPAAAAPSSHPVKGGSSSSTGSATSSAGVHTPVLKSAGAKNGISMNDQLASSAPPTSITDPSATGKSEATVRTPTEASSGLFPPISGGSTTTTGGGGSQGATSGCSSTVQTCVPSAGQTGSTGGASQGSGGSGVQGGAGGSGSTSPSNS